MAFIQLNRIITGLGHINNRYPIFHVLSDIKLNGPKMLYHLWVQHFSKLFLWRRNPGGGLAGMYQKIQTGI
jgi:hypothetical protein